ncbi:replication-relaxation family protein [Bacillus pseudomycoides]|uniref:replication-relaxation family protein n=1 Tax=Bacillus pseudomycoides TaxID=64104 RepID=UPI0027B903EB|nr:replication-relaxation family protein [Bacillus pseudomycoides]
MKETRTDNILSSLKRLGFLTRKQIQVLHDLGGDRNASRVMKELSEYVSSFRDSENVYYLNKEGRERIGCKKILKRSNQFRHYIMRNDIYIAYECPGTWKQEVKMNVKGVVSIIADALFNVGGRYHIVEIDHEQKMSANRVKMQKYRKLIDCKVFDKPPRFIWYTCTEYRRKQVQKLCEGLDCNIFTVTDFH